MVATQPPQVDNSQPLTDEEKFNLLKEAILSERSIAKSAMDDTLILSTEDGLDKVAIENLFNEFKELSGDTSIIAESAKSHYEEGGV